MSVNPSVSYGATISTRLGYLKAASISGAIVSLENGTWNSNNNFAYTNYAYTPPTGNKQKVIHARGTSEVSVSLSGNLTTEAAGVFLSLLSSSSRGQTYPVAIQQDNPGTYFPRVVFEEVTLTGAPNSIVSYSVSGKSLTYPTPGFVSQATWQHPLASWSTGNTYVTSWSISHRVTLSAKWWNNQNALPYYYRPGESEYSLSITTNVGLMEHSSISIGIGGIGMISGVVTSRSASTGGRTDPQTYSVEITNVDVNDDAYTSAVGMSSLNAITVNTQLGLSITQSPTGGTFKIVVDDEATTDIPYNANAALIQTALEALSNVGVGNISVTGSVGGPFTLEFIGIFAGQVPPSVYTDGSNLIGDNEPDVRLSVTQEPFLGVSDILGWPDTV